MSDSIAVMNLGELQQVGNAEDVYERPANSFVAQFIGISNLLEATAENGGVRLDSGLSLPAAVPSDIAPGSSVRLSIRPEKLALGPPADGRVSVEGTIVESVYMGTVTHYVIELAPGARMIAVAQNTEDASGGNRPAVGARAMLSWRAEHALVLALIGRRDGASPSKRWPSLGGLRARRRGLRRAAARRDSRRSLRPVAVLDRESLRALARALVPRRARAALAAARRACRSADRHRLRRRLHLHVPLARPVPLRPRRLDAARDRRAHVARRLAALHGAVAARCGRRGCALRAPLESCSASRERDPPSARSTLPAWA